MLHLTLREIERKKCSRKKLFHPKLKHYYLKLKCHYFLNKKKFVEIFSCESKKREIKNIERGKIKEKKRLCFLERKYVN